MKRLTIILTFLCACVFAMAQQEKLGVDLTKATIVYQTSDAPLVKQMADVLADDIERVSGIKPQVATRKAKGANIMLGTVKYTKLHKELQGSWERYAIDTKQGNTLYVTGSDARGLAY